jgi:hypothetical protein
MKGSFNKLITFKLGSTFPAKAKRSVVFPELGGPKSNVILETYRVANANI